ncbi:hypothetical protein PGT21_029318 [Puccinia graminis f. sp. tritici]|uniref:Secreted protein n=1 Tax=Puccinia graminis f. sp. tritici TaxID=56615 RepID=A0A5B0S512_PUCGR|nr:hypothetical protein PGT21_029318 [Puccinia graminis f. sp. tritici]KAA1133040.1 hypothetical protein PGTUg99_025156 [Puccinia graminis f. sp. tritici]
MIAFPRLQTILLVIALIITLHPASVASAAKPAPATCDIYFFPSATADKYMCRTTAVDSKGKHQNLKCTLSKCSIKGGSWDIFAFENCLLYADNDKTKQPVVGAKPETVKAVQYHVVVAVSPPETYLQVFGRSNGKWYKCPVDPKKPDAINSQRAICTDCAIN